MENDIRVVKKCPVCGQRLFDKISLATGYVEMKCPRCGTRVRINLALRRKRLQCCQPAYYYHGFRG